MPKSNAGANGKKTRTSHGTRAETARRRMVVEDSWPGAGHTRSEPQRLRDFGGGSPAEVSNEIRAAVTRRGRSRIEDSKAPSPRTHTLSSAARACPRNKQATAGHQPPSS